MAKATESASLSVEPQRTKTRSWLRLPQPCLIAWLRNCRRRIDLKAPARTDWRRQNIPHRRSLGGKRRPGASPLSSPSPPGAEAEGQSLQGTVTRPRSVTEGAVRMHIVLGHSATTANSLEHASLGGQKTPRTPGVRDSATIK